VHDPMVAPPLRGGGGVRWREAEERSQETSHPGRRRVVLHADFICTTAADRAWMGELGCDTADDDDRIGGLDRTGRDIGLMSGHQLER